MRFKYKVIWINPAKNKREFVDVKEQNIAIFIAKKKVNDGMQEVIINVTGEPGNDTDDPT